MSRARLSVLSALLCVATAARAEPKHVLRLAAVAPEGTAWAQELKRFAADVAAASNGEAAIKLYLSAIAGTELEVEERIRRGQLDGTVGGLVCQRLSPSMRALRMLGEFESVGEANHVLQRLNGTFADEFQRSGYALLATSVLGPDVFFTRAPARSLGELRRLRLWRWEGDQVVIAMSKEMGLPAVALPVEQAARAFDDGKLDGFVVTSAAALAFQLLPRAPNLLDVRLGYLAGCLVATSKSFDKLSPEHQQAVRAAAVQAGVRFTEIGVKTDEQLFGGVFQKKGVRLQQPSDALRSELFGAARAARDKLEEQLVPASLRARVGTLVADYRAEHRERVK